MSHTHECAFVLFEDIWFVDICGFYRFVTYLYISSHVCYGPPLHYSYSQALRVTWNLQSLPAPSAAPQHGRAKNGDVSRAMNCGDVVEGKVIEICQDMALMGGEDWEGKKSHLPETNSSHLKMDGWNTIVSFWDGLFSGAFAVSFWGV